MSLSWDGRWRIRLCSYLGIFLLISSRRAAAQEGPAPQQPTIPTCSGDWNLFDPSGHNPCEILVDAMTNCTDQADYILRDVTSESLNLYPVPSGNTTTCECNEVVYNLFQACAACQLGADTTQLTRRQTWFANCPSEIPTQPPNFTEDILWITQVYEPGFNVTEALQVAHGNQPLTSSTDSNTTSSKMSNTPIIVGVVVGVVVLLVIIGILFFFFMRRKRSRTAPSKEFMQYAPVNQAITAHDEESASIQQNAQRSSATRNDSGVTEELESLPTFTPGLFKDPIFEKGAALNIASHAGYSGATGSPITYSPATPSTTQNTSDQQRLIQSRQPSGS